jgi:hypothetical protein
MMPPSLLLIVTATFVVRDVISITAHDDNVTTTIIDEEEVCSPDRCVFNETFSLLDCTGLNCASWRIDNLTAVGSGSGTGSIDDNQLRLRLTAEHLSLRGNRLKSLASLQPFGAALRTVDASHNEISSIDVDAFFLSDGLTELNLSSNRLTIGAFRSQNSMTLFGLTALRSLDLSNNNFTELSQPDMLLSTRTTLVELDLSDNVIAWIADGALADLSTLESLDLSRNRIQSLTSRNFLGLTWLQRIDLSDNQLESLPDGLFAQCHRLRLLDLRRNTIRYISAEAFDGLDGLTDLLLDDNKLPDGVPAVLPPSLRSLSLDGSTELEAVSSRTFVVDTRVGKLLPSLELLSIRRCPSLVRVEPGAFGMLKRLTIVQLTDNPKLTSIDDRTFEEADSARDVWIGDAAVKRRIPVTLLNFSGNALHGLGERLINWKSVKAFDFSGNAWNCDCHMNWMHWIDADNASLRTVV